MKNSKGKIIKRAIGIALILAGLVLVLISVVLSHAMLGIIGISIVKIGGLVIKISLIIKVFKKLTFKLRRNKKAVVSDVCAKDINQNNIEVILPEILNKPPPHHCTDCNAIIGAGTSCAFCGGAI